MSLTKETANQVLQDLLNLQQNIYEQIGYTCTLPEGEAESKEYGAFTFKLGENNVVYRLAKITPTKVGQFVTVWKRIANGPIRPFDYADDIDYLIIKVNNETLKGLFIFPKSILLAKGILSAKDQEGKRGFRVYPPWDVAVNKQAQQTQQWQLPYFMDLKGEVFDKERAAVLLKK